jgi:hypothetical protein
LECFFIGELFFVDQNPEQLNDGDTWMRVVELNGVFGGEIIPVLLTFLETANDILKCGTAEEVLLF